MSHGGLVPSKTSNKDCAGFGFEPNSPIFADYSCNNPKLFPVTACLTDGGAEIQIPGNGDQFGTVRSPGFPYIVPEHSRCRWTIIAPSGKVCT